LTLFLSSSLLLTSPHLSFLLLTYPPSSSRLLPPPHVSSLLLTSPPSSSPLLPPPHLHLSSLLLTSPHLSSLLLTSPHLLSFEVDLITSIFATITCKASEYLFSEYITLYTTFLTSLPSPPFFRSDSH
jgi:hypothetical protein